MDTNFIKKVAAVSSLIFVGACAQMGTGPTETPVLATLDDVSTGSLQFRPAVVIRGPQATILHSTKEGRVALQQGKERKLLDETARVKKGGSYFQLKDLGDGHVHALWWSHEKGKNGYFTASTDGGATFSPVSMVNSENQILQPITWVQGKEKVLGIAYHDERLPNYQVFFNRSLDGGRSWAPQDQRLDTPPATGRSSFVAEPQLVQTSQAWILAWVDTIAAQDGAFRVIMRKSVDDGLTWSEPKTLYAGTKHISALAVRSNGDSVAIVADELEKGIFSIVSSDHGMNWTTVPILNGTEHASNSGIETSFGRDRLHITWMQDRADTKTRIYAATLDLVSKNWISSAQRLDIKTAENTRSQTPTILATKAGPLIAAWVDYRDIRSNIYLAYSYDQGNTWSEPEPLSKPGALAHGWPQLLPHAEAAALAYEIYPSDRVTDGRFIVESLAMSREERAKKTNLLAQKITAEERSSRLRERIRSLWDARIAADYATAYEYFDFAYKSATPKKNYVEAVGVITYLDAKLDTVEIVGNEARVNMKLRYEVKPTIVPFTGKPIVVAPVDVESPNTWVWVDDDWYLVYHPTFDPPVLKY